MIMFGSITQKQSKQRFVFVNLITKFRHVRSDSPGDFFFRNGFVSLSLSPAKIQPLRKGKTIVISTPVLLPVHDV